MSEHVFTDDEIRQIIDVINRTKHTQYIGARYVPIFGRKNEENIQWDNSAPYEPLTIVLHQGNSYTSRQYVPAGVEITNERYWANTGNYNAQVEQYRQEVAAYDRRITTADQTANNALSKANTNETAIATNDAKFETFKTNITKTVEAPHKKTILILGDSWTQYNEKQIEKVLKGFGDVEKTYNYGVSGNRIEHLPTQAQNAYYAMTEDERNNITHIVVVCGTNNVFWNGPISFSEANGAFSRVKHMFPQAIGHYFPDNSRVYNMGNNNQYAVFMEAALYNGFVVHPETLTHLWRDNFFYYLGVDTTGVQHLTTNGYNVLANYIHACLNGEGYLPPAVTNYPIDVEHSTGPLLAQGNPKLQLAFSGTAIRVSARFNVVFKEDATGEQRKKPDSSFKFYPQTNTYDSEDVISLPTSRGFFYAPCFIGDSTRETCAIYFNTEANPTTGARIPSLNLKFERKETDYSFSEIIVDTEITPNSIDLI